MRYALLEGTVLQNFGINLRFIKNIETGQKLKFWLKIKILLKNRNFAHNVPIFVFYSKCELSHFAAECDN